MRDGRVEVCQLGSSSALVPSIVSIRDDGIALVGEAAERRVVTDPTRTVREFKRRIGDDAPYIIGGTPYTADQLAGFVLSDIVTRITDQEGAAPRRVALTHPAEYGSHKLDRLRAAAAQAGINAPLLVAEPVAAALAYMERAQVPVGGHVLVYDFGGGTFDAAMVRRDADGPTLVGSAAGLERLGGVDLDAAVFNHVDQTLGGQIGALDSNATETRAAIARLRDESRAAKEALSADTETDIPVLLPGAPPTVRLTRPEFEAMAASRIDETLPVLDRVVDSAGLVWADVASVLLVGGSSRIPLVAQRVASHSGRPVATDTDPKASVATGAALIAARSGGGGAFAAAPPATAAAAMAADSTEETEALTAEVVVADTGDEPPHDNRRRVLLILIGVALAAIAAAAFFIFASGGDDDPEIAATDSSSTTSSSSSSSTTSTSVASTTSTSSGGVVVPPTRPPTTRPPTTQPQTTTTPAPTTTTTRPPSNPFVTSITPDTTLTCVEANAFGNQFEIEWTTEDAESVRVAIDGFGTFQDGLPPNGSIDIPATCGDVQIVRVTAIGFDGNESGAEITQLTIGPP